MRACHVSQDQARSARKLAKLYDSPKPLLDLSVREVLRLAKGKASSPDTARLLRNLKVRLRNTVKAGRAVAQNAKTADERMALARTIERTVAALRAIRRDLAKGENP